LEKSCLTSPDNLAGIPPEGYCDPNDIGKWAMPQNFVPLILAFILWALVISSLIAGQYPSHGKIIRRAEQPVTYWIVMSAGFYFGLIFFAFSFLPVKS